MRFPKGEIVWVGYHMADGTLRFFLTSKPSRDYYYLYEVTDDGSYKKLGKSKSPPDLEEKYNVLEKTGIVVWAQ